MDAVFVKPTSLLVDVAIAGHNGFANWQLSLCLNPSDTITGFRLDRETPIDNVTNSQVVDLRADSPADFQSVIRSVHK